MRRIITLCLLVIIALTTAKAQPNNALSFSVASSQYVSVPHSSSINLGSTFTIEAWVNYSGGNRTIIDKGDYDFLWQLNPTGNNNMGFINSNTGSWRYSTTAVPQNTWTHVAITLSGGTLTFYINGVASGTSAVTATQDGNAMNIGRQQPTACQCNHFNGQMDELRIWNIARTQSELAANYTTSIASNSSGLVAYYKFDEGTGSTLTDATSNANNGTLQNSPTWVTSGVSLTSAVPTITSFTPTSGTVGTTVTITGTGFNTTAANNIVYFGATKATVSAATATSLTVSVPVGASCSPITVISTSSNFSAKSTGNFTPTFTPSKSGLVASDFGSPVNFTTSPSSWCVMAGDIDGDTKADLVTTSNSSSVISVLLNTSTSGSISMGTKTDFSSDAGGFLGAMGDIDGDGKLDVTIANLGSNTVSIFRNTSTTGTANFATAVTLNVNSSPRQTAIGDLDGDGKPDIAVTNLNSNNVSIFLNTGSVGNLAFSAKTDITTGAEPYGMAIQDIDGDGKQDLIVVNNGAGNVGVYRNTSTGVGNLSFATPVTASTGTWGFNVAIADLDGDGKSDLVVAMNANDLAVIRNTSTSGSISFATKQTLTIGSAYGVSIGDLNGDGKPDIVDASLGNLVAFFPNTSVSGTISFGTSFTIANTNSPIWSVINDMDGDGKPDVIIENLGNSTVSIYPNNLIISSNADLSTLTTTAGTISPSFAASTTAYTASVSNATTSVTVTPTRSDANATIQVRVNGGTYAAVTSGSASSGLSLNVGANPIDVRVTAQDGTTIKTYTITVTRATVSANALDLDGTNDYVEVGTGLSNLSNYTLEANVYYKGGAQWMMNFCDGTFNERIQFEINAGQLWCFSQSSAGGGSSFGGGTINTNTWYHVAMTNSTTAGKKLYINGVLVASNSSTLSPSQLPSGTYFNIGRIVDGYHFNGVFDDIRVWNVERSASEISANMSTELVGNESGLRAYYKLNQGTAGGTNTGITTATDATSNGNNGTLMNFALTGSTSNWVAGVVAISNAITWTGSTNTDWATAGNWSTNAVPTSTSVVIIPSTVNAPNNAGVVTVASLTVAMGVAVTNNGTINITGAWSNAGTITGTVNLNGSSAQTITGTGSIANLTLNNSAGATISSGNTSIVGTLTVTLGTLTTGGFLTLKSTASNTARIANSAGTVSGNVTQERFIPAKATRRFSFITSPVSQALSAAWQQQIHITGAGTGGVNCPGTTPHSNGFDATVTNAPNLFSYNASAASGSRWVANTTGTTGFTLTPGTGYRLNVRGARSIGCNLLNGNAGGLVPTAVTISATGAVNNASKNAGSFSNTYNNNLANNWVLMGNPYPSEIDFSAFRTANSGVINASYIIYDPANAPDAVTPANMYSTWNAGTWSNAPTSISNANGQYIASGQAFFVQAINNTDITLNFAEAYKYAGTQNGVFRTARTWNDIIRIALNKDAIVIDQTVIRYANEPDLSNNRLRPLQSNYVITN